MTKAKIAVTLESELVERIDALVAKHAFESRSNAIELAVSEKLERLRSGRLASECEKLDPKEEKALADEGLSKDSKSWPEY